MINYLNKVFKELAIIIVGSYSLIRALLCIIQKTKVVVHFHLGTVRGHHLTSGDVTFVGLNVVGSNPSVLKKNIKIDACIP